MLTNVSLGLIILLLRTGALISRIEMRIGDQCVFVRYFRTIRPGVRVFKSGNIIVATQKIGDVTWIFYGVDSHGAVVPWLRDRLDHQEFVRLRHAAMISRLPGPPSATSEDLGSLR